MPAKYMNSFTPYGGSSGNTKYIFAWSNDPAEDAAFVTYVETAVDQGYTSSEARNAAVDRSGPAPVLTYERWNNPGTGWVFDRSYSVTLSTGSAVYRANNWAVTVLDTTGYWDSDQYGRPFNLNDLLA